MSIFSRDLGIDLGTANVVIYAEGKGIVLREPAVVVLDKNSGKILRYGSAARNMLGRTPGNLVAIRPMKDGVIADYELTLKMLTEFLHRACRFSLVKPRVIVSVPSCVTGIEERAVVQTVLDAGARRVYLTEEPLAAGLGAGMDLTGAEGHMVVDVGGGTTDIGVLTMNGIANSASVKVAGDAFDDAIVKYVRKRFGVAIGLTLAETIKLNVGTVFPREESVSMDAGGRDLKTGLPKDFTITSEDALEALKRPARQIADEVVTVLEQTSPELVADIAKNGIVLTGGGSLISGMDKLIHDRTGMPCSIADDADSCVAYGCGKAISWIRRMQEGPINIARRRLMKE